MDGFEIIKNNVDSFIVEEIRKTIGLNITLEQARMLREKVVRDLRDSLLSQGIRDFPTGEKEFVNYLSKFFPTGEKNVHCESLSDKRL